MNEVKKIQLVILASYLLCLLGIGYVASRFRKTLQEYFLADRGLGAWVSGISSAASSESGWVTLGLVGMGYALGFSAVWIIPGILLGYVLNWYFIAPELRQVASDYSLLTIPDFLENRVQDQDRIVRIVAVGIIFLAMSVYVGAQFKAAGELFQATFFPEGSHHYYIAGVLIGAFITLLYTYIGGFRAVSWTDLFQGLLMFAGLVVFPVYLVMYHPSLGSVGNFVSTLQNQPVRAWAEVEVQHLQGDYSESTSFRVTDRVRVNRTLQGGLVVSDVGDKKKKSGAGNVARKLGPGFEVVQKRSPGSGEEGVEVQYVLRVKKERSDVNLWKVQEGNFVGFSARGTLVPPPSLERIRNLATPIELKRGVSYFLGRPGQPTIYRVRLTGTEQMNGQQNLVDPFGTSNDGGGTTNNQQSGPWIPVPSVLAFIIGFIGIGLGYPGMPHVHARFMATSNHQKIRQGRVISIIWGVGALYGALLAGMLGRVLISPADIQNQEHALLILANQQLSPYLSGLLIAVILAAIMSTADSMLIVASSAVSRDVYEKIIRPNASQAKLVWISKGTVLILGILAVIAAVVNTQLVFWFVLVAWAILGASFGPPVLLACGWSGLSRAGVLAGMITGSVSSVACFIMKGGYLKEVVFGQEIYELVPAFVLSFIATWLFSLLFPPSEQNGQEGDHPGGMSDYREEETEEMKWKEEQQEAQLSREEETDQDGEQDEDEELRL